ncbi:hypothetical protein CTR2_R24690 [Comamonas thiooxydans]|nr:hypothetical protein CTR2_R24690 [Comamonas thiooxydans]
MKSNQPYPEEFKIEVLKQITERSHKVAEVSARISSAIFVAIFEWGRMT